MRISTFILILVGSVFSQSVLAADFAWLDSLSISAQKNESGFSSKLGVRFHIGNADLRAVIRDSGGPADAYMVLRLAELSHQPRERVIKEYRRYRKGKAWGKLAKSLGIKPGSKEFHALKAGHDLGDWNGGDKHKGDHRHADKGQGNSHHLGGASGGSHKKNTWR